VRVVSLLPAATEIVAALGAMERLVGVTHACDFPPLVASRARVTAAAVDGQAPPGAVDADVRLKAAGGAPMFELREDVIRALHPDLLLTQALCDVCAVNEMQVRALAARLTPPPAIVTLSGRTIDGVLADIAAVASALGLDDEGEELLDGLRARLRAVHDTLKAARAPRPRAAVLEWTDPLFAAGHWVPEMVHRAGGQDVLAGPGDHSAVVDAEKVRAANPEVLLVAPCGYELPRARAEAGRLLADPRWKWLRESGCRVWAMDGNGLTSRPGPRIVDGVEVMARIFNGELFSALDPSHGVELGN
jgi:iron complex transport system substrate-binding protein